MHLKGRSNFDEPLEISFTVASNTSEPLYSICILFTICNIFIIQLISPIQDLVVLLPTLYRERGIRLCPVLDEGTQLDLGNSVVTILKGVSRFLHNHAQASSQRASHGTTRSNEFSRERESTYIFLPGRSLPSFTSPHFI